MSTNSSPFPTVRKDSRRQLAVFSALPETRSSGGLGVLVDLAATACSQRPDCTTVVDLQQLPRNAMTSQPTAPDILSEQPKAPTSPTTTSTAPPGGGPAAEGRDNSMLSSYFSGWFSSTVAGGSQQGIGSGQAPDGADQSSVNSQVASEFARELDLLPFSVGIIHLGMYVVEAGLVTFWSRHLSAVIEPGRLHWHLAVSSTLINK